MSDWQYRTASPMRPPVQSEDVWCFMDDVWCDKRWMMYEVWCLTLFHAVQLFAAMCKYLNQFLCICIETIELDICQIIVSMQQFQPIHTLSGLLQGYIWLWFEICFTNCAWRFSVVCSDTCARPQKLVTKIRDSLQVHRNRFVIDSFPIYHLVARLLISSLFQ